VIYCLVHEYFQKYKPQMPNLKMDLQRKDIIKPRIYRSGGVGKSVVILKEMQDTQVSLSIFSFLQNFQNLS